MRLCLVGQNRLLNKDYEQLPTVSKTWMYVTMIYLTLRCPAS